MSQTAKRLKAQVHLDMLHQCAWRRIDQRTSASALEWMRPSGPPSERPSAMESDPPSGCVQAAKPLHKQVRLDVLHGACMAADRPAHLGVGDGVGAAVGAAVGEAVADGVGSAVGLCPSSKALPSASASRRVARRRAHLGVGDGVGAAVGAAVGEAVGDGVGSTVGLSSKQQSPFTSKCVSTCCTELAWRRIDQRTSASAMEWVRPSEPPSERPSPTESDPPSGCVQAAKPFQAQVHLDVLHRDHRTSASAMEWVRTSEPPSERPSAMESDPPSG